MLKISLIEPTENYHLTQQILSALLSFSIFKLVVLIVNTYQLGSVHSALHPKHNIVNYLSCEAPEADY